jgi:hypothetical protein
MGGGWWGGVPGLPREDNVYAIACYPCPRKGKSGFFVLKRWTIYEIRFLFYCLSTTKKRLMERIYSSNNFFFFFLILILIFFFWLFYAFMRIWFDSLALCSFHSNNGIQTWSKKDTHHEEIHWYPLFGYIHCHLIRQGINGNY